MKPERASYGRDYRRIAFAASDTSEARAALKALERRYGCLPVEEADVLVVLGGDGWMLRSLHANMESGIPVYGMNCGSVGFLMNSYQETELVERLENAVEAHIHPLRMMLQSSDGGKALALAINEVSLWRSSHQAAKIRIRIDSKTRLDELICDGVLLSTPAGSTAYNLSVQGPILPIDSPLLALTPISAFRPRRWRGALLSDRVQVFLDVLEAERRPVQVAADFQEFKDVQGVEIRSVAGEGLSLLFDSEHSWEERILREQFQF